MRNWLIRILGGYTQSEVDAKANNYVARALIRNREILRLEQDVKQLQAQLKKAMKNEYRGADGRFIKAPKGDSDE